MEKKTRMIILIVVLAALAGAVTTIVLLKTNTRRGSNIALTDSLAQDTSTVDTGVTETGVDSSEPVVEQKNIDEPEVADQNPEPQKPEPERTATDPLGQAIATGRPVMVDFGRGTCIPCKKMMPILAELKEEYSGRVEVLVLDLDEYLELAKEVGIQMIPTQIFYDTRGTEVARHIGFMEKDSIIAQFARMSVQ